jgi:outer membrane protein TolC
MSAARLSGLALTLLLAACAGPVAERAFDQVAGDTAQRIGQRPAWIKGEEDEARLRTTLDDLLSKPLGPDQAVQVALLNNRGLQRSFADLGIGAADLTASWRPPNPGFSYGRLRRGGETEIERGVGIDVLGLLALPIAAGIEERRFEQTKLQTAVEVLALAAKTKRAWYEAVAAQQSVTYMTQLRDTTDAQVDLARRMRQVGNWSALDYAREQLFHAETTTKLARSRVAATVAREKLARLMGLWGRDVAYQLPDRLPVLPGDPRDMPAVEAAAIRDRLDVKMALAAVDGTRKAAGLTTATRFVNVLELGYVRNSETGKRDQTGYEIRLEVPLFDFGDARASKAEFTYMGAVNRLAEVAVNARSAARETYLGYRTAYDLARHYQTRVIPLRQQVGEEMVLRYNGMLVSVFDLLADARDQIADVTAAMEAQRDFWLADTDLTFVTLAPAGL